MKVLITEGIILSRTNFGEADRIITILTPDQGKLRLMAKGVRKVKSKLAGGIELFSISDISYVAGKKDIGTLVSTRLKSHYGRIISDIDRVQLGYELLKATNKATEDNPESEYFDLLGQVFIALDDMDVELDLVGLWFGAQLLKINGHTPNLRTDIEDNKLELEGRYNFDVEQMMFVAHEKGLYGASNIKVLRLLFSDHLLSTMKRIEGFNDSASEVGKLLNGMLKSHLASAKLNIN